MKIIRLLVLFVIIEAGAVVGFAYSGLYDVAASSPHGGPIRWLLSTTARASVENRAGAIEVPELDDEALRLDGINSFDAMCTGCHGAPGEEPQPLGRGLNPPAPDLTKVAGRRTPAELFWVTKHGIRMTGMPAWGVTHDDGELWAVVAFLAALPDLDAADYRALLERAEGAGHHGTGSAGAHDHDDGTESPDADTGEEGAAHDHSH